MEARVIGVDKVSAFLDELFEGSEHVRRVSSISGAVVGVLQAGSLAISMIGYGLAKALSLNTKHAIKQVDRLLSNVRFNVWEYFALWVPYIVGAREEIVVAMDWTEFDHDDQSTIAISLITCHGRATPLLWYTVVKSQLKGWRNAHEDRILTRLRETLPAGVKVTILADRGFGDHKRYRYLRKLGFDYVIRFRQGIHVQSEEGEARKASEWVSRNGRPKLLRGAKVTSKRFQVGAVVCVKKSRMKEPWCLATSFDNRPASEIVKLYGRRFTIEENFRDTKDIRFGMGLAQAHVRDPSRRDRLLFVSAAATVLVTLLGAAGESLGMDRMLKANTVKRRTHSLFTQGRHYYEAIPNMHFEKLAPLIHRFVELVREQRIFDGLFGII